MNEKAMEYMMDPVSCRILIEIMRAEKATVSHLCSAAVGIPRSTMYRRLQKMEREGVVNVVSTERKRGTVEKTYAIDEDFGKVLNNSAIPSKEQMKAIAMQYFQAFLRDSFDYIDSVEDMSKLRINMTTAPLYLNDGELESLIRVAAGSVQGAMPNTPEGRKLYSVGIAIIPDIQKD